MNSGGVPDGVEVVAVVTAVDDGRSNYPPSDWFVTEGYNGKQVVDNTTNTLLQHAGATGFPFLVAVDGSGTVVERVFGETTVEKLNQLADSVKP